MELNIKVQHVVFFLWGLKHKYHLVIFFITQQLAPAENNIETEL
jgi:hypothetical protein